MSQSIDVMAYMLVYLLTSSTVASYRSQKQHKIHYVDHNVQHDGITREELKCLKSSQTFQNATFCHDIFDGIYCWQNVQAGETKVIPCPNYFHGFYVHETASRKCESDGKWYVNPATNGTYTNYTTCVPGNNSMRLYMAHVPRIRLMSTIGYGMSLVSLVTASFILLYFKRLHCPRNTMHINLFLSFILRASVSFAKDTLLVDGYGMREDVLQQPGGDFIFITNNTHYKCKLLFSTFQYSLAANYMWIFMEGLYLHNMIFWSIVTERSSVTRYIVVGWLAPCMAVLPWALVRLNLEDELCWNTHPTAAYHWIMKGPIVVTVIVNFIFFLNILRVLFSQIRVTTSPDTKTRNRKLASATLVLIPLFGVQYMVFVWMPDDVSFTQHIELVKLYIEMFFSSFQGFIVAALYCFLSGEVKNEVRRKYRRYRLSKKTKTRVCMSQSSTSIPSYSPRRRHSYHNVYSSSSDRGFDSSAPQYQTPEEQRYLGMYVDKWRRENGLVEPARTQSTMNAASFDRRCGRCNCRRQINLNVL